MKKRNINKIIHFQRKPIQVSNSLQPQEPQNANEQAERRQEEATHANADGRSSANLKSETLEIPKGWRTKNVIEQIRNRLIATVESSKPLIPIANLFESQQLNDILGKKDKSIRESLSNMRNRDKTHNHQSQPLSQPHNQNYLGDYPFQSECNSIMFEQTEPLLRNEDYRFAENSDFMSANQMNSLVIPGAPNQLQPNFYPHEQTTNYLELLTQDQQENSNLPANPFRIKQCEQPFARQLFSIPEQQQHFPRLRKPNNMNGIKYL